MPIVRFTGFGRAVPAVRGRFALRSFSNGSAQPTVMLSESIAGERIHSGQSRASAANIVPRFDTCHHVQAVAFFRARTQIVAAGRFSGFANERRRPNARSNSSDTRRQGCPPPPEGPVRRLAAILAADISGYSRLMQLDEEGTYARVMRQRRELIEPNSRRASRQAYQLCG